MNRIRLLAALAASLAAPTALAGELSVTVTNFEPKAGGQLRAAIYDSPESFDKAADPIAAVLVRQVVDGSHVAIGPLPPGRYAIRVFQDINGNGKVDTNLFGMPTEPIGFSNDAMGSMGPPSFDAAAVTLGETQAVTAIKLRR